MQFIAEVEGETQGIQVTEESFALFLALAKDAGNWSGEPLIDISPAQRGNLTQLKQAGLLTTFVDEGCSFAQFTTKGVYFAAEHVTGAYHWRQLQEED